MMSIRELIPSLGKELDELRARVASLEGLFGIGGISARKSSGADRSCRICGITWQLGVTCFPRHMAGKRHKGNMEKLSNIPPPSLTKPLVEHSVPGSDLAPASTSNSSCTDRVEPLASLQPKYWSSSNSRTWADESDISSKNITVWYGTGHTKYTATRCKVDIMVKGVLKTQSNVLGRLQSITCMKEYKNKSLEELHWEDYRAGRKSHSGNVSKIDRDNSAKKSDSAVEEGGLSCEKSEKPTAETDLQFAEFVPGKIWSGSTPRSSNLAQSLVTAPAPASTCDQFFSQVTKQKKPQVETVFCVKLAEKELYRQMLESKVGVNLPTLASTTRPPMTLKSDEGFDLHNFKEKELNGVVDEDLEKLADEEPYFAEVEAKGGELLKEKESVKEVESVVDERSDKLAAKELPCADSTAGKKDLTSTPSLEGDDSGAPLHSVREEDGVVSGGDLEESSSAFTQILSLRPKLKGKVKK